MRSRPHFFNVFGKCEKVDIAWVIGELARSYEDYKAKHPVKSMFIKTDSAYDEMPRLMREFCNSSNAGDIGSRGDCKDACSKVQSYFYAGETLTDKDWIQEICTIYRDSYHGTKFSEETVDTFISKALEGQSTDTIGYDRTREELNIKQANKHVEPQKLRAFCNVVPHCKVCQYARSKQCPNFKEELHPSYFWDYESEYVNSRKKNIERDLEEAKKSEEVKSMLQKMRISRMEPFNKKDIDEIVDCLR